MTFEEASTYYMPLGKYRDQTLEQVAASSAAGLKYLDWIGDQPWLDPTTKEAVHRYLEEPAIAKELEGVIGESEEA